MDAVARWYGRSGGAAAGALAAGLGALAVGLALCLAGCAAERGPGAGAGAGTREAGADGARSNAGGRPEKSAAVAAMPGPASDAIRSHPAAADREGTGPRVIVTGRVTLPGGGPAAGALVRAERVGLTARRADAGGAAAARWAVAAITTATMEGLYAFDLPDTGDHRVMARLPGVARGCQYVAEGAAPGDLSSRVAVVEAAGRGGAVRRVTRDIPLEPAASVSGRVVGPGGGAFAGAVVRVVTDRSGWYGASSGASENGLSGDDSAATTSTAGGAFTLSETPISSVTLVAEDPAGRLAPVVFETAAPCGSVELRFAGGGGRAEGNVFRLETGAAVAGATVTLSAWRGAFAAMTTATDELGGFAFDRVPSARFSLSASKGDDLRMIPADPGRPGYGTLAVKDGETTTGLTLTLYGGHAVVGTATDRLTSAPLADVEVWTDQSPDARSKSVRTGADGRFRMDGVFAPRGDMLAVKVEKPGYARSAAAGAQPDRIQTAVRLDPKALTASFDFLMARAVIVRATVKTETGEPVAGAAATLVRETDIMRGYSQRDGRSAAAAAKTDKDGRVSLEAVRYTRTVVRIDAPGMPLAFGETLDLDDRDRDVEVVVKRGAGVSGRVLAPDGSPVAGAKVDAGGRMRVGSTMPGLKLGSAVTGPDGGFAFIGLMPGPVTLKAGAAGYAAGKAATVELKSDENKSGVELTLRAPCFLGGKVSGADGGALAGIEVSANSGPDNDVWRTVKTGADGRYRFEEIPDLPYTVALYVQNLPNSQRFGNVSATDVKVGRDDVDFTLGVEKPVGVLVGKVVDEATGAPVTDFEVKLDSSAPGFARKGVPVAGTFTFDDILPDQTYFLTFTAQGFVPLNDARVLITGQGPLRVERTYKLGRGGSVGGRIVRGGTGVPAPGVRVLLDASGSMWNRNGVPAEVIATGADGRFRFGPMPAGEHTVTVKPDSPLVDQNHKIDISNGVVADLGDLELGAGGAIKGKVLRGGGAGQPVVGAAVVVIGRSSGGIENLRRTATSGDDGAFAFDALPPQSYGIEATASGPGGGSVSNHVSVVDGHATEVTLRIGGGVIRGKVTRAGKPVARAMVSGRRDGESLGVSTSSDADGQYTLAGLVGGAWTVSAYWQRPADGGNYQVDAKVELPEAGDVTRDLLLISGALKVLVLDSQGRPVEGAVAKLISPMPDGTNRHQSTEPTKADGTVRIDLLRPDRYTVTASKARLGETSGSVVTIAPDSDAAVEVTLKFGEPDTATGTVVSTVLGLADGKPVPGAFCNMDLTGSGSSSFDHGAVRGADGTMTIDRVPAGVYSVVVSAPGFSFTQRFDVEVKPGSTVRLDDVLYDAGSFQWNVSDRAGRRPDFELDYRLEPADAASIETPRTSRAQGYWSEIGLAPGLYKATVSRAGRLLATEQMTIVAKQKTQRTTRVDW